MKVDINNLPNSPQLLQQIIKDMQQELTAYQEKYASLVEAIRLEKQRRFASSSEKMAAQEDLFDEAGIALTQEVQDQLSDAIDVKGYIRKSHPVRRSLPKALPREVIVHDLSSAEKVCPCGAVLVKIGEEVTEQLKYIPAQLSVVRHVRPKYACKPCQETVKIAPMPTLLLPKSIATPELVAYTIVAKYVDHLPLYRQEAMWNRLDIDLPRSSLCGWVIKTALLCEPLAKLLQKTIVHYDYAQADETTLQVLNESERANTTQSYLWCYRGGGEQPCVVFEYQETRAGRHAEQFLSGFKGYLQTDAYAGYHWADNHEAIVSVGCHAHARRPFAELAKLAKTPGLAQEALRFYRALYAIEEEARKQQLSPQARYALRQEKATSLLNAFKEWCLLHLTKTPEQSKIGKAIRYCLTHWASLTQYLNDGRIEIDNNLIENAIRPFALGRKNWLFAGSPTGAKAGAILYSLIETCKANNIESYQYFCTMLPRIRFCQSENDYQNLLPHFIQL